MMKKPTEATSRTECASPPALSEDELFDALDGLGQGAIQSHLDACEFCTSRLAELRQIEENLLMLMYRSDCPSADKLADYVLSMLITSAASRVEEHLQSCLRCQSEVASLKHIVDINAVAKSTASSQEIAWQPLKNFAQTLRAGIVNLLQAQHIETKSQYKGNDKEHVLSYSNRSVTVMLALEKVANGLKVTGSILDVGGQEQWQGSHIELVSADDTYYAALVDEDEAFRFADVLAGHYRLNIYHGSGFILRIAEIELQI